MKWKQAKFKIIMEKGSVEEVKGKVTTFNFGDEKINIGVFDIYQLTKNDFDKGLYSVTELTTGMRITVCGSLSAATRSMKKFENDIERLRFLNKVQYAEKIIQNIDVLN